LYGKRLRQPIGGEFGLAPKLVQRLTKEDVWETDVARFGIDIWMTTIAVCEGFKVCETALGTKLHDPKDPSAHLGPMFRQVVGTLFAMMPRYEKSWRTVNSSDAVPLLGDVPAAEPEQVNVALEALVRRYRDGLLHFGGVWKQVVQPESFEELTQLGTVAPEAIDFPVDLWVRTVYDFAVQFQRWAGDRHQLVEMLIPIYYARVASFVNQARNLSSAEAERLVEVQAERFEALKPYFIERWDAK